MYLSRILSGVPVERMRAYEETGVWSDWNDINSTWFAGCGQELSDKTGITLEQTALVAFSEPVMLWNK